MKYIANSIISYRIENVYDNNYKISKYKMILEFIYQEDINQISNEIFLKQAPLILCIFRFNPDMISEKHRLLFCDNIEEIYKIDDYLEQYQKIYQQSET